jgi:hypothetical protein
MKYKGIPTNTPGRENSLMHLLPHQHLGVLRLRHAVILCKAAVILSKAKDLCTLPAAPTHHAPRRTNPATPRVAHPNVVPFDVRVETLKLRKRRISKSL